MDQLGEVHQGQLARFAQFFKGKRDKALIDRESEKNDFVSDHLSDDAAIFNRTEVENILLMYSQQVMGHLREQLEMTSNLSAVYVSQLFLQAEQAGLLLQVDDISVVEDQSRLTQIQALQGAPPPAPKPRAALPTITASAAPDPQVLQEMQDLRDSNQQLTERYQAMQGQVSSLLGERSSMSAELDQVKANFEAVMNRMHETGASQDAGMQAATQQLEQTLNQTQYNLDTKSAEAEALRRDLDTRLADSTQFRDLKGIVQKKSSEIRALKDMLRQYGIQPPETEEGGVELVADDD
jgi:hypothetical protein